jgi:hypothetical protein
VGNRVSLSYANSSSIDEAVKIAKAADVAIVFVATDSSEGSDRASLSLGTTQDNLVAAVAKQQKNTIVVVHTPGAVLMPWADAVSSILCAWLPGQEDGEFSRQTIHLYFKKFRVLCDKFKLNHFWVVLNFLHFGWLSQRNLVLCYKCS